MQFNMQEVMSKLKVRSNRIFYDESGFQFEIAQTIKSMYPEANILFEVPFSPTSRERIDIVVILNNNVYPIELKYKRGDLKWSEQLPWYNNLKQFKLSGESYRIHLIKDIERIEKLIMGDPEVKWNNVHCGYAVWLTNNPSYYNYRRSNELKQAISNNGTIKKGNQYCEAMEKDNIVTAQTKCDYTIQWLNYYDAKNINNICIDGAHSNNQFKYAIIEVTAAST